VNANIGATKEMEKVDINKIEISKKIYIIFKRFIDILGALVGCIILLPLTIGIWIANIIAKDNGPVFYVQKRIGKDGKTFKMYKYRSMIVDADRKLKRYLLDNPEANKEFMEFRKLKDDPRITAVGRFIRKTSLDEFPQFINVLKGDMSLVGPRPYLSREKRAMGKSYKEIIKVKPGVTGPWQVNGRSETDFEERVQRELEYANNMSLKLDLKILLKTILAVLKREGAK